MSEIGDILRRIIGQEDTLYSKVCSVISVDKGKRTINAQPLDGTAKILNVRLQASINQSDGGIGYPVAKSLVLVTFINKSLAYVAMTSQIESFEMKIGSSKQVIKDGLIELNEGQNDGIPLSAKVADRISNIEKAFNNLLNLVITHEHPESTGGITSVITPPPTLSPLLPITTVDDIKNPKITQ